jgi:hypothetical protein
MDHFYILLDFLIKILMARFIHSRLLTVPLLRPGKNLKPAIGSAKDMNTEKHEFD